MTPSSRPSDLFPERLRVARTQRQLSQEGLAKRANLQPSAISHFETGTRKPSFDNLRRLADALEVTTDYLLGRVDEMQETAGADRLHRHLNQLSTAGTAASRTAIRTATTRTRPSTANIDQRRTTMLQDREHDEHGHGAAAIEELIDLEEWAKAGKPPKPAKVYRIRIDTVKKDVNVPSMTGRQILALIDKTPETYMLSQKIRGSAPIPIGADTVVHFDTPGIERFQTLARDPTEG